MVKKQLDFLQYYFINRIKEKDYKKAISLLGADLQIEVQEEHMEELHHIFTNHQLQLINSKEGFSSLEREHVYLYSLQDNEGEKIGRASCRERVEWAVVAVATRDNKSRGGI